MNGLRCVVNQVAIDHAISVRAVRIAVVSAIFSYGNNLLHQGLSSDFCAMALLGNVQIIQINGVLGVVVAAADALSAVGAGSLQRSKAIQLLFATGERRQLRVLAKKDIDIDQLRVTAGFVRNLLKQLCLRNSAAWIGCGSRNWP